MCKSTELLCSPSHASLITHYSPVPCVVHHNQQAACRHVGRQAGSIAFGTLRQKRCREQELAWKALYEACLHPRSAKKLQTSEEMRHSGSSGMGAQPHLLGQSLPELQLALHPQRERQTPRHRQLLPAYPRPRSLPWLAHARCHHLGCREAGRVGHQLATGPTAEAR